MGRAATEWTRPDSGRRYEGWRFRTRRARGRDPRLVSGLLRRHGSTPGRVLDIPAGTGRLMPELVRGGARYFAADLSRTMLAELGDTPRLVADVRALPFADGSFDAAVCCRLLHHLDPDERRSAIAELVRVSRDLVIASFWDSGSWHAWRRRAGLRRAAHPDSRRAVPRAAIRADLEAAGARVLDHAASLRFVSPQTFVVARVDGL